MRIFFRNDDMGWDAEKFSDLLDLFRHHETRLNCAAIPVSDLPVPDINTYSNILQVHVHGFSHKNHNSDPQQKKSEYPNGRPPTEVKSELAEGLEKIKMTYGPLFTPLFTPPWNRFASEYHSLLKPCGYLGISQSGPRHPELGLPQINIDIDLHTNKSAEKMSLDQLWIKIQNWSHPTLGIMLHHNHMNIDDFSFLDGLLHRLREANIHAEFMGDLIK